MAQQPLGELSAREREILELVTTGATNRQIAVDLTISVNTVKAHLRNVFAKLGVESRTEATLYAIQHGVVQIEQPAAQGDSPLAVGRTPEFLAPHRVPWPLVPGQRLVLLFALLVFLCVALWPSSRASSTSREGRLVDEPPASSAEVTLSTYSRWNHKAQMPTPRGRFAQAEVEGTVFVIAGQGIEGCSSRVEAYYPAEDRWDHRASKPTAVANVGAAVVNGLIYVPGGMDKSSSVVAVLEIYDPLLDSWSTGEPLPEPLCAYAIAPFGDGFYVIGGVGGPNGQTYRDAVYYFDSLSEAWRKEAALEVARGFAAAATVGDRVYVLGGYDGSHEFGLCQSFEPALAAAGKDPWQTHAQMSIGRAGHGMAVLYGNLYVVGGGWDTPFTYNERYDVANDAWSTFESPIIGEWRNLGLSVIQSKEGPSMLAIGGWNGRFLSVVEDYTFWRVYLP